MRAKMRKKINFDLRKKLKTNKTLTKDPRIKMINQKNKDRIGKEKKQYMTNCNLRSDLNYFSKVTCVFFL
jgi:hypothetical protein